jgi:hypothetical protein
MRWVKIVSGGCLAVFGIALFLTPVMVAESTGIVFYGLGAVMAGFGLRLLFTSLFPESAHEDAMQKAFDAIPYAEETSGISDEESKAYGKRRSGEFSSRGSARRRR